MLSQDTITGSRTTHDTNLTLFQVPFKTEESLPLCGEHIESPLFFSNAAKDLSKEEALTRLGKT